MTIDGCLRVLTQTKDTSTGTCFLFQIEKFLPLFKLKSFYHHLVFVLFRNTVGNTIMVYRLRWSHQGMSQSHAYFANWQFKNLNLSQLILHHCFPFLKKKILIARCERLEWIVLCIRILVKTTKILTPFQYFLAFKYFLGFPTSPGHIS